MAKIIMPEEVVKAHIDEYVALANAKLRQEAQKEADKVKHCPNCRRKHVLKVMPLREDPHPLPSKFVMYCPLCSYNRAIMARDSDKKSKYYEQEIQKLIDKNIPRSKTEPVIKDEKLLNKLVPGGIAPKPTDVSRKQTTSDPIF